MAKRRRAPATSESVSSDYGGESEGSSIGDGCGSYDLELSANQEISGSEEDGGGIESLEVEDFLPTETKEDGMGQKLLVARCVEDATSKALDVLRRYHDEPPEGTPDPWKDPVETFRELDRARKEVIASWNHVSLKEKTDVAVSRGGDKCHSQNGRYVADEEEAFTRVYMEFVTEAFGEELDGIRHRGRSDTGKKSTMGEGNPFVNPKADESDEEALGPADTIDVDVLVDCLKSGSHILTQEERELLSQEHRLRNCRSSSKKRPTMSPHERRRQNLGFAMD